MRWCPEGRGGGGWVEVDRTGRNGDICNSVNSKNKIKKKRMVIALHICSLKKIYHTFDNVCQLFSHLKTMWLWIILQYHTFLSTSADTIYYFQAMSIALWVCKVLHIHSLVFRICKWLASSLRAPVEFYLLSFKTKITKWGFWISVSYSLSFSFPGKNIFFICGLRSF